MDSKQPIQGFFILLIASLIALSGDWLWKQIKAPGSEAQAYEEVLFDGQAKQELAVEVGDSVLIGAESWDYLPSEQEALEKIETPFHHFFRALDRVQTRKDQVRIAYFGDSMIEGDLITQSLRNDLQQLFGGNGVGFVPITSMTYSFRRSIWHRFSNDWKSYNFLKTNPTGHDFGISGELFIPAPVKNDRKGKGQWVRYQGSELFPTTEKFERVKLFYGQPDSSELDPAFVISKNDHGIDTFFLQPTYSVNELLISSETSEEIQLEFHVPQSLPVYGISFDSHEGISLDNFSSRGSSGKNLIEIPDEILRQFNRHLDYDLIVLHFGINVTSSGRTNYESYERAMKRVVNHFRTCMPETDILMVSVSDRGIRMDGNWQTHPSVPLVLAAQRRVAEETGVGFLDLYSSMGGRNAMLRWVEKKLANRDYIHPTRKGARVMAGILKNYLLSHYEQYSVQAAAHLPDASLSSR